MVRLDWGGGEGEQSRVKYIWSKINQFSTNFTLLPSSSPPFSLNPNGP